MPKVLLAGALVLLAFCLLTMAIWAIAPYAAAAVIAVGLGWLALQGEEENPEE